MNTIRIEWRVKENTLEFRMLEIDGRKANHVGREKWRTWAHGGCRRETGAHFIAEMVRQRVQDTVDKPRAAKGSE